MEKFKKEIPFLAIALIPFVYLIYIWNRLPEKVPMHWNGAGEIDRYGDKKELLVTLFMLVGITYFVFLIIPSIDPKQKLQNMGNKLNNLRMILTLFMSGLAVFILYSVQQKTSNPSFVLAIIGLLFAFLGNYFKTIKPNYFIGIKTPWTLENEEVWKKTHELGGKLWFIGGLLMALTFVLPNEMQLYTFLGITAVISIVPIVYSYLEFKKIKNQ
ncbi:MAG: SdpI family protein [Flavobacterium sp.]|uniref:SdpI family protein n=1 Tax=Flavobacterium sp. TaxID=239 RepID=UPI0025C3E876|nr:SdpI family protein [Flavobacterium sp.]MCA1966329.1 SdpI family protein [Flavobacterium sp.]